MLAIMIAGMATITRNEVTSIDQTNSGMRSSDMPGRALLENRHDDLDRDGERRNLGEGDHLRPDVGALAGAILRPRQAERKRTSRRPGPCRARKQSRAAPAREKHPVGERIEAREGDVARPHHQRDEIDGHRFHDRHGEQEHHVRAVHGENLIVAVWPDQPRFRLRKLQRASATARTPPSARNTKAVTI